VPREGNRRPIFCILAYIAGPITLRILSAANEYLISDQTNV
jgi:hypothetical protein